MGQSWGSATALLALLACLSLCCLVTVQASDEIKWEREQIFVKLENGFTFKVMVDLDENVQDLLHYLVDNEGLPSEGISLQLGDTLLDDRGKLSLNNIRAGTTLTLVIGEEGRRLVTVNVITRDGQELPIKTMIGNTVASLKDNIMQLTGIPQVEQRLLLSTCKELKDDRKLMSYHVYNRNKFYLGRPLEECRREVTIYVKTLSGATIALKVNLVDTVDDLKEKIRESTGVPTAVQRLFRENKNLITGADHLCDLDLGAGSIVYMYLYSSKIKNLDQVASFIANHRVAPTIDPDKGPIFREVGETIPEQSATEDLRNWVPSDGRRYKYCHDLFDPIGYLSQRGLDDDLDKLQYRLKFYSGPTANIQLASRAVIVRARIRLISALMPYRLAANITTDRRRYKQFLGISLGGGFTDASLEQRVPLGADVNNWAPDAFTDLDVMRLFEVAERVRQVMASNQQASRGVLSIAKQRQINTEILSTYLNALCVRTPSVMYNYEGEGEECVFCKDDLSVESALKLPCGHSLHADCIQTWVASLYQHSIKYPGDHPTRCPCCRNGFIFPYDSLGGALLEEPEMQANQDYR